MKGDKTIEAAKLGAAGLLCAALLGLGWRRWLARRRRPACPRA